MEFQDFAIEAREWEEISSVIEALVRSGGEFEIYLSTTYKVAVLTSEVAIRRLR